MEHIEYLLLQKMNILKNKLSDYFQGLDNKKWKNRTLIHWKNAVLIEYAITVWRKRTMYIAVPVIQHKRFIGIVQQDETDHIFYVTIKMLWTCEASRAMLKFFAVIIMHTINYNAKLYLMQDFKI